MKTLTTRLLRLIIVAAFALTDVAQQAGAAIIANYAVASGSPVSTDMESNSTASNFTLQNPSTNWGFSGLSSNVFARSPQIAASQAAALASGDYFSFTVTPNATYELDLLTLNFDTIHNDTNSTGLAANASAKMNFFVRSSVNGFASNIGSTFAQDYNSTTSRSVDLYSALLQNLQTPTEFRFYIYDSGVDTRQGARLDNVSLNGSVVVQDGATTISFQEGVSPTGSYTQDATYIRTGSPTTNFNAAGQLIAGATTGDVLRTLLEFDVSAIPAADQIDSASLVLTTFSETAGINNIGAASAFSTFNVFEYGFDFDETTATWNAPGTGDTAGGTTGALLTSASFDVEITGQTITFDDTPAFRAAVSNALANDGILRLILRGLHETPGEHEFVRFTDDENAMIGARPTLIVTHTAVVPEPSTAMLVMLSLVGLGSLRRRRRVEDKD